MNENSMTRNEEIGIDFQRAVRALLKRAWLIAAASLISTVVAFLITFYLITPMYKSSAMFYVNNNDISVGNISASITANDLAAAQSLVDSYIVILKSRTTIVDVIDYAQIDRTVGEVSSMISAEAVNSTEIFQISVTSPDPLEAEKIANSIAYILPKRIGTIIDGTSAKVVDYAIVP